MSHTICHIHNFTHNFVTYRLSHTITSHTHTNLTHNFVTYHLSHTIFAWQAWRLVTSTFVSCGRRGTHGTGWRAWARFSRGWRRGTLLGRHGTWWHPSWFHVAGVAQSHIYFVLRGRRGTHGTGWRARARFSRGWCCGTLCGRRGTWWHPLWFHVAGLAQSHIHLRFAWQAWH